ncbi:hypothetical protein J6590_056007 [Homalodisca vitripennis]|nr:hypothetical protein J6590_056007 [Homalodisca vitripennis]
MADGQVVSRLSPLSDNASACLLAIWRARLIFSVFSTSVLEMSSVEDVVLAAAACVILSKQRKPKRYWIKPSLRARSVYSGSDMLNDLQEDDIDPLSGELRCDGSIKNFLCMASSDFEHLIVMLGHVIGKQDTNYRKAIPVQENLAVTLRVLDK